MKKETLKPFVVISSPDDRFKFWVPQHKSNSQVVCIAGFDLSKFLPLVDAIDSKDYAIVQSMQRVDSDLSYLTITLRGNDALSRLCDDIPDLMDCYVLNETAKKVDQSQVSA